MNVGTVCLSIVFDIVKGYAKWDELYRVFDLTLSIVVEN